MNAAGHNGRPAIVGPPIRNPEYATLKPRRTISLVFNLRLWTDFLATARGQGITASRALSLLMEEWVEATQKQMAARDAAAAAASEVSADG